MSAAQPRACGQLLEFVRGERPPPGSCVGEEHPKLHRYSWPSTTTVSTWLLGAMCRLRVSESVSVTVEWENCVPAGRRPVAGGLPLTRRWYFATSRLVDVHVFGSDRSCVKDHVGRGGGSCVACTLDQVMRRLVDLRIPACRRGGCRFGPLRFDVLAVGLGCGGGTWVPCRSRRVRGPRSAVRRSVPQPRRSMLWCLGAAGLRSRGRHRPLVLSIGGICARRARDAA